jgi:hypothetical protein
MAKEFINMDIKEYAHIRGYTLIDDKLNFHLTAASLKQKRKAGKPKGMIKKYFATIPYFRRLFPIVKEQKPGVDMYKYLTLCQFLICIYLISYYTEMDLDGTSVLEDSSEFSFKMVCLLFLQIIVMIMERYINRTNTKITKKKIGGGKDGEVDERLMKTMNLTGTDF